MRNLFIIILLVPITMFGQVKKEVAQVHSLDKVSLNLLNKQFKIEQTGRVFQLFGLGMMSYGFLSNYILSTKEVNLEMSFDESNDEIASRLEKIQNNELISGLGALISSIGIVIPMNFNYQQNKEHEYKAIGQLHVLNGRITFKQVNSTFRKGDRVFVKTLYGPTVVKGVLSNYFFDRIEIIGDEGQNYILHLNILEYIELEGLR